MIEEIYIDGVSMELDAAKVNVQLIYQSPVLTDFESVVSNRTTQVTLPRTNHNTAAVGYTGTQAVSLFPYRKHSVLYKRDGVQILEGTATLLEVTADGLTFCFTWGNVSAVKDMFDVNLRELGGSNEVYTQYPPISAEYNYRSKLMYGQMWREGVAVKVSEVLQRIEDRCGVSGLSGLGKLDKAGRIDYALGLTSRNGNLQTRNLQGTNLGLLATSNWQANLDYVTALRVRGGSDPHQYMDSHGVMDLSASSKVRVHAGGRFRISFGYNFNQPVTPIGLRLLYYRDDETGWNINRSYMLCEATVAGAQAYDFIVDHDVTYDCSTWDACCLCVLWDTVAQAATPQVIISECECNIIPDPDKDDEVIYGSGLVNTYPVFFNLPDMSCGQFVKNLLWLHGAFAHSKDGRTLEIITMNDIRDNISRAVDWTDRLVSSRPAQKSVLDGTAQRNLFLYAAASYYDNTMYQGVLECDDETITPEAPYCETDLAIAPENKVPVWSVDDYDQWQFADMPCVIMAQEAAGQGHFYMAQNWSNLLSTYYEQFAELIRRPQILKADILVDTALLAALDMAVPVYLKQTGCYYIIRTLAVKGARTAEVELVRI